MLAKKIEVVKTLLPESVAQSLEITNVVQSSEEYWNKYNTAATNSEIAIVGNYKGKKVQINFFQGIGYRDDEERSKVVVSEFGDWSLMSSSFYYNTSNKDETCQELWRAIELFCYGGVNENKEECNGLFEDNSRFIYDVTLKLVEIEFITVNEKVFRDTRKQTQINTIQRLAKASQEASSGVLYQVHVVCANNLEVLEQNLTQEEAIERYLSLANYWYANDETFSTLEEVDDYRNSEAYLDNGDDVNVVLEVM